VCSRWENGYYNYINKQNIKKHAENEINYLAADSHVEGWNERACKIESERENECEWARKNDSKIVL